VRDGQHWCSTIARDKVVFVFDASSALDASILGLPTGLQAFQMTNIVKLGAFALKSKSFINSQKIS
jgi:hypothetical protein